MLLLTCSVVPLLLGPHFSREEAARVVPGPLGHQGDVVDLGLHVIQQGGLNVLQGAGLIVELLQILDPLLHGGVSTVLLLVLGGEGKTEAVLRAGGQSTGFLGAS